MKNLLKSVLVLVFMLVTQQASAACWANANHVPPGTPPLFLQNGMWCTTQNQGVQRFPQAVLPVDAIQVPVGTQAPQGYCSWSERFLNVGASALVGGVLGALATDTDRGAGEGAALGGLVGVFIPCAQAAQVANTPGMVANQGVQGGQTTGVTTSGVACSTGGETFLVNSTEQCARMAMKIATTTPATVAGTVATSGTKTPDGKIGCNIDTGTEKFRFNAVNGRKFDREQCDRYLLKLDPLPKKEGMSLL